MTSSGVPTTSGSPAPGTTHDAVGVLHDALEAVLGEQHGDAEVVHEPLQRGQDLFGRTGIERRGRLVEHEHLRVAGEHRADRDALALPAGQRAQRAVPQVGEAEQVEGLLDAAAHDVGREADRLHAVGELVLDHVGDEARERVLRDDADDVGELARRVQPRVAAGDRDPPGERAAGEVRDQAVDAAQQRRLAAAGATHDQHQLALGHVQVDVREHGRRGAVVGDGDVLEADHAATSSSSRVAGTSRTTTEPGGRGATTPASAASGDRDRRQQRQRGPRGRSHLAHEHLRVGDRDGDEDDGRHDAGQRHEPLRQRPRVGAVARADAAPSGEQHADDRRGSAEHQERQAERTRGAGVEQRVDADADADQPDEQQRHGREPGRAAHRSGAPVAARVHRRGEVDGALERTLEHRHHRPGERPQAAVGSAAETSGGADPCDVADQLRCEGHRDDDGDPDLVERRRHAGEQPRGGGERVRRADAREKRREHGAGVHRGEELLEGERPAEAHTREPLRQRHLGQRQDHVRARCRRRGRP